MEGVYVAALEFSLGHVVKLVAVAIRIRLLTLLAVALSELVSGLIPRLRTAEVLFLVRK